MERTHHIDLVPGFLGSAQLGRITDFGHVRRFLRERSAAADARVRVRPEARAKPPHVDWLVPGSGFDEPRFEALWGDIV